MHAGRHYTLKEIVSWTGRDILVFSMIACLPMVLCMAGVPLPPLPWAPVAVLGTAVAFVTSFKSNAAYGRLWEARKIWGAILNASRSFAIHLREYVGDRDDGVVRAAVLRHVAWLTALRFQLRQKRTWESQAVAANRRFREATYEIPEDGLDIVAEIRARVSSGEWEVVGDVRNRSVALLSLHAKMLRQLAEGGVISEYRHVDLSRYVTDFIDLQGKCERIKNFPYPRQFATLNRLFVWLFICVLPFAIASEMQKLDVTWAWMTVPLTVLVAWVFHTMDRIGSVSENPFEGSPNDIPITQMSRAIEIDMLELVGDKVLPAPIGPQQNILM
ncbi:MAG: bestrophin family protein [Planctomycetota bacterium]|jgi:putative membrane protein